LRSPFASIFEEESTGYGLWRNLRLTVSTGLADLLQESYNGLTKDVRTKELVFLLLHGHRCIETALLLLRRTKVMRPHKRQAWLGLALLFDTQNE
jgi:hypothetical protein